MRDLNEDSSSNSWPTTFYGDKDMANGKQCCHNGSVSRITIGCYNDRDAMKQKMLEHETVFRSQLYELHRLYRIQRDMMEEAKRKEFHRLRISTEPSSSSSLHGDKLTSVEAEKGLPLLIHSGYGRASASGVGIGNSPMGCTGEYNTGPNLKGNESLDSRPSKVRKKLLDLQLPADRYLYIEEREKSPENNVALADLNKPIQIEEETVAPSVVSGDTKGVKPNSSYPLFTSSCSPNSWLHSASSHLVPDSSFIRKRAIFDSSSNSLTTVVRQFQPFVGNSKVNSSSSLNPFLAGELTRNGFYRGPTSGAHETRVLQPLSGLNYRNLNLCNNSSHEGEKQTIDIDLNEVVDLTVEDERDNKPEDCLSSLPWLSNKRSHAKEAANTMRDEFPMHFSFSSQSSVKDLDRRGAPRSSVVLTSDCEILGTINVNKILGIPVFDVANNEQKKRIVDLNLECEPVVDDDVAYEVNPASEKENQTTSTGAVRNQIDLNSCVSDSEDPNVPSFESKAATGKRIFDIDLEAPPQLQESEDDFTAPFQENTKEHDESLEDAAEIIFSMSSFRPRIHVEENVKPPLLWFVDVVVSSYCNEIENTNKNDDSTEKEPSEDVDDFEAMTLQLQETKEDYLPLPFVPEIQETEENETNNSLLGRCKRGHTRRRRQRKDFQRDILPGLSTLSRHEVTEDLQAFGGIMRAMGHRWNSGLTRRNGGARGRRRAAMVEAVLNVVVQQNRVRADDAAPLQKLNGNDFERGFEDRSLTGWGKTTRRPRRQRCHAGNNAATAVFT